MNPMNPEPKPPIQERLIDELLREPLFDEHAAFGKELKQRMNLIEQDHRSRGMRIFITASAAVFIVCFVVTSVVHWQASDRSNSLAKQTLDAASLLEDARKAGTDGDGLEIASGKATRNSIDSLLNQPSALTSRTYDKEYDGLVAFDSSAAFGKHLLGAGGQADVRSLRADARSYRVYDGTPTPGIYIDKRHLLQRQKETISVYHNRYAKQEDQPWKRSALDPVSTFSIDVDHASYSNIRGMLNQGFEVPRDAVRIEECINAFAYDYREPAGDAPFAVGADIADCPWAPGNHLVRIAIKGKDVDTSNRPASNLVFLIDVSGSMTDANKLPLVKHSLRKLASQLNERDRVAIVVYAGSEGVVLPSTKMNPAGRKAVLSVLERLEAGGSTNGGAGIERAYELAKKQFLSGGTNRVILATDGDFNVGITDRQALVDLIKDKAKDGVYLTVLGYGMGNLNDEMMDAITRDGNGNYYYIDSEREGDRVFGTNLAGTLVTIAKDVKIQVEFNPAKVSEYRLVGYTNRMLANEDFANDKVDAGDIGSGHTVTAFYEVKPASVNGKVGGLRYQVPLDVDGGSNDEWLAIKLRHKAPDGDVSRLTEFSLKRSPSKFDQADADFRFASAVAMFGMKLRAEEAVKALNWNRVRSIAEGAATTGDAEQRREFVGLVSKLVDGEAREIEASNNASPKKADELPAPAEVLPQE
jgi:Ca-activated chloride channel family protein